MMNTKRLASVLLTLGLGLTSMPATSWAAPMASESRISVSRQVTVAPWWSQGSSGDFGVLLLDVFASTADTLTAYQDALATEAYLGTACDSPC